MTPSEYDDIRAYELRDLEQVIDELLGDEQFLLAMQLVYQGVSPETIRQQALACSSILDFQKTFFYLPLRTLMSQVTSGFTMDDSAIADKSKPYTFISNHRDIVLDPALLQLLMLDNGFPMSSEIAIGDNLFVFPWIERLVRLNKAFVVQRSLGLRETLLASKKMSAYMHYVIREKGNPIWIAQREGRAKDSNDCTQDSVLKMIALGGTGTVFENIREMNIVPLAISYEYDPCDYLKAKEFQQKRDVAGFKKSREDDLLSMQTGIMGFKGKVHFRMAPEVNDWLDELAELPKGTFFAELARRMDRAIFRGYRFFPNNYVALDVLEGNDAHAAYYTLQEKERFLSYVEGQVAKVDLPDKDEPFLRERILTMYANPLRNYEAVERDEKHP